MLPTWHIEEDPPAWLLVDPHTLKTLRRACQLHGVREVHLSNDVLDLDSAVFERENVDRGASYALRLDALLQQLEARRVQEAKAKRDHADASKGLRRFRRRPWWPSEGQ